MKATKNSSQNKNDVNVAQSGKYLYIPIQQIIMYSIEVINFTHILDVHSHRCQIFTGIDSLNHNLLKPRKRPTNNKEKDINFQELIRK